MRAKWLQSCLTLYNPMHCSQPGCSVHGILQARILEWVASPSPGDLPDPGIKPMSLESPMLAGGFFTTSATWETQKMCLCAQLCLTYWDPLACSLPGSSVHKILQARILEWVAISSFRESSQPRDWTCLSYVFCIDRQILYHCATWEASWL